MTQDIEETPTVFRKFRQGGDIIALFPFDLGNMNAYTCNSYMHVGQHGAAEAHEVLRATNPAQPEEYADLRQELESIGYRCKVMRRIPRSALKERQSELNRMRRSEAMDS